jgi:hypothetical protein
MINKVCNGNGSVYEEIRFDFDQFVILHGINSKIIQINRSIKPKTINNSVRPHRRSSYFSGNKDKY